MSSRPFERAAGGSGTLAVLGDRRSRLGAVSAHHPAPVPSWRWLAVGDGLGALVILLLASNLLPALSASSISVTDIVQFVAISWVALAVTAVVKGIYPRAHRHIAPAPADDLVGLEASITIAALLTLALGALAPPLLHGPLAPGAIAVAFGGCAVALPLVRAAVVATQARTAIRPTRIVVVGTGTIATDVAGRLSRSRHVELVGFVDDEPVAGHPVLGGLADLPTICARTSVDRVVVAFSRSHPARTTDILRSMVGQVAIDVVPRYFELTGWAASVQDLDGLAVISLDGGGPGRLGALAKRAFDLLGASFGLLVLSPVLLAAVVAIKLSSPGPVLFRQSRLGRHRQRFEILKLRTMREPDPSEQTGVEQRAPGPLTERPESCRRLTAAGRLMRRLGVDELPQLINVVRGEMSLVGPRPFVPEECAVLPEWVDRRFEIRPGLTGLWQVCGQHNLRFDELCRLDCQYVASWSCAGDVRILARTPGRLLRGGGGEPPR